MHGAPVQQDDYGDSEQFYQLQLRLGAPYARQRLGIEQEKQASVLSARGKHVHLENLYSLASMIRFCLRCTGLYGRAVRNSRKLRLNHNRFAVPHLPTPFEGFRILHLSDLHLDMDENHLEVLIRSVQPLEYDLCVITGDYRRETWGDTGPAMAAMARLRPHLKGRVLAVLGNHDSVTMVPELETMGYEMLINEHCAIERGGERFWVAGVDDAHYYRMDNIQRVVEQLPIGAHSLLLSHTPEIYRQAAHAGFDLFLCGHTHGGQLCLPGGIPLTLDAKLPRKLGRGAWQHQQMQGYTSAGSGTSILNVRLNCPPEITLHTLQRPPE
ncbi:MAG: metallophosphoesterase [Oleiphilaceae bacterium]|nr:metallophosphoesterase [Oleiphilaceae bacterium]